MNTVPPHASRLTPHVALLALLALLLPACSVKRLAVNKLGDALAGGGTTFASDDDPELVKQAVPFSLKLMESLLAESPKHRGLLFATASGFTQYGFAFVQQDADELEDTDFTRAQELRARARRLYLRARDYGLRGLD
ncbi:MAG: TRAP transporter TatT component family protein, partial [Limisphaerales bacterium]